MRRPPPTGTLFASPPPLLQYTSVSSGSHGTPRTAGVVTIVGGALIFLFSFFLMVFAFVFSGAGAGLVMLIFGIIPGFVLILAGTQMQRADADPKQWGGIALVFALMSFISSGGLIIGAILGLVGAGMALTSSRSTAPPRPYFTVPPPPVPAAPMPPPRPAWDTPAWAPPPPPAPSYPTYSTNPSYTAGSAYTPAPPYSPLPPPTFSPPPDARPNPSYAPAPAPAPNPSPLAALPTSTPEAVAQGKASLTEQAAALRARGFTPAQIAAEMQLTAGTVEWLLSQTPAPGAAEVTPAPASPALSSPALSSPALSSPALAGPPPMAAEAERARVVVPPTAPTPRIAPTQTPLQSFLAQDPNRSFDLEALNAIDFSALSAALEKDKSQRSAAHEKASALLERISADIADIDTVDDFLRDRTVLWFRDSPNISNWSVRQGPRWAGLVSETRTAGGARTPALLERLKEIQEETAPFQGPARKVLADFRRRGEEPATPASSLLPARLVQAVLDDLAATARVPGQPTPLLRLSELANKHTAAETNKALAGLFKADLSGPFVILHPSRYPEFEFVLIRPPPARAAGAAIAYEMVSAPAADALPQASAFAGSVPTGFAAQAAPVDPTADLWSRDAVGDAGWTTALGEFERRRERIPTPPSDFRRLPPYFELRKLIIANPDARRTFLAVRWRGKPPGLALLARLLSDGSLSPEVETDAEYLDAELSDVERGDPNFRPTTPSWAIASGVRVTRTGDHGAFRYAVS